MSEVRLETVDVPHIGGTPFYGFAVRAHAALIDYGQSDPRDPLVDPADGAVVARVGEELVGTITYRYFEQTKSLWACAAFVLPDWRRRGVFRHMFEELVQVAERRGAERIEAGSQIGNGTFGKVAAACGMAARSITYGMDVAPLLTENKT